MATFYILPARPFLADYFAEQLQAMLPGMDLPVSLRRRLLDRLLDECLDQPGVYLIPRDELPIEEAIERSLIHLYGAEDGDEVIEVRSHIAGRDFRSHRWCISADSIQVA